MDYFTELITTVAIGLAIYFIEKYLGKYIKKLDTEKIEKYVQVAVEAIEQKDKMKDMSNKEKFDYVFGYVSTKLKDEGVNFDFETLELLIEHVVFNMNKQKEENKNA